MKLNKQYLIPILLVIIFLMPFFSAYWSYQTGVMRQSGYVNHGFLLKKTILIPELQSVKKWQLAYVVKGDCEEVCMQGVDTLARIRLALGRRLYGLDMNLLLVNPSSKTMDNKFLMKLKAMDVGIITLTKVPDSLENASVWVVDNHAYGVLTYKNINNPSAIYADLKKLSELWAG